MVTKLYAFVGITLSSKAVNNLSGALVMASIKRVDPTTASATRSIVVPISLNNETTSRFTPSMESTTVETAFLISGGIIALSFSSESLCIFFTAFMTPVSSVISRLSLTISCALLVASRLGVIHRFLKFVGCAFPIKLHDVVNYS